MGSDNRLKALVGRKTEVAGAFRLELRRPARDDFLDDRVGLAADQLCRLVVLWL